MTISSRTAFINSLILILNLGFWHQGHADAQLTECNRIANLPVCEKETVADQRDCLNGQGTKLDRCISLFGTDWVAKQKEETQKFLTLLSEKVRVAKEELQAELMKEQQQARELQDISKYYEFLVTRSSKRHAIFFGTTLPIFNTAAQQAANSLADVVVKMNTSDTTLLLDLKHSLITAENSLIPSASLLVMDAESAKASWGLVADYYQSVLKVHEAYFKKHSFSIVNPADKLLAQLEQAVLHVGTTRAKLHLSIEKIRIAIEQRVERLILIAAEADTRKSLEGTRFMEATTKFMAHVNAMCSHLFDPPTSFSNGYLDIETRYRSLIYFIDQSSLCADEAIPQGAWKHAGCVLLQGEIEGAKRYIANSLPLFFEQELQKLSKYDGGRLISQVKSIRTSIKAVRMAEALASYNILIGTIGGQ